MLLAGENKSRIAAGDKSRIIRFRWGWITKKIVRINLQEKRTLLGKRCSAEDSTDKLRWGWITVAGDTESVED